MKLLTVKISGMQGAGKSVFAHFLETKLRAMNTPFSIQDELVDEHGESYAEVTFCLDDLSKLFQPGV